jgi:hypothetical protein
MDSESDEMVGTSRCSRCRDVSARSLWSLVLGTCVCPACPDSRPFDSIAGRDAVGQTRSHKVLQTPAIHIPLRGCTSRRPHPTPGGGRIVSEKSRCRTAVGTLPDPSISSLICDVADAQPVLIVAAVPGCGIWHRGKPGGARALLHALRGSAENTPRRFPIPARAWRQNERFVCVAGESHR